MLIEGNFNGFAHLQISPRPSFDYLLKSGINSTIILDVTTRTPGFVSWQGEIWLSHCDDACAFLGDATQKDVLSIADEHLPVVGGEGYDNEMMKDIAQNYVPKGSPAFYKFVCLHSNQFLYAMDYD